MPDFEWKCTSCGDSVVAEIQPPNEACSGCGGGDGFQLTDGELLSLPENLTYGDYIPDDPRFPFRERRRLNDVPDSVTLETDSDRNMGHYGPCQFIEVEEYQVCAHCGAHRIDVTEYAE